MKRSAGIIPFRWNGENLEFFVGHPGGKYWEKKNYWAFLKGGIKNNENILQAALREFYEESGIFLNSEDNTLSFYYLGDNRQNKNKTVYAFGILYPNIDITKCKSNMADNGLNYEIDKYSWKTYEELKECTHSKHLPFYEKLIEILKEKND